MASSTNPLFSGIAPTFGSAVSTNPGTFTGAPFFSSRLGSVISSGSVLTQGSGFEFPTNTGIVPPFLITPTPVQTPPSPVAPAPTATASDLQIMISAIPIAQDGHVITADFHNALRLALVAIANRLGIGPVAEEITITNSPRLSPVSGAQAWEHDYGFVKRPTVSLSPTGNVRGWMELELPDGARIKKMMVFGTTFGIGTLKAKLRRQKVTDPTVVTDLIVIEIPDGNDPGKGIEGDVTVPGTGAGNVAIEEFRIVNNREQKYLLAVELDGINSDTSAQFHSVQIVCGGEPGGVAGMVPSGVTVNRLRIRCGLDPVTARVRASSLFDESDLAPAGLPPSAILCIRRLIDPRPGLVALDGGRPSRVWREHVSASIAALARGARRPAHGDVPPDAEAVIFTDRAEMLAVVASDWCTGRLASRWWSRALLAGAPDLHAVLRAWLDAPEYIAAALDELASRRLAVAFVQRLDAGVTRALADAVVVRHGLRWLAPVLETLHGVGEPGTRPGAPGTDPASARTAPRTTSAEGTDAPPWDRWVSASEERPLAPDQRCLLAVALMTRRAPSVVRSAGFAADLQQWLAAGPDPAGSRAAFEAGSVRPDDRRGHRAARAELAVDGARDPAGERAPSPRTRPRPRDARRTGGAIESVDRSAGPRSSPHAADGVAAGGTRPSSPTVTGSPSEERCDTRSPGGDQPIQPDAARVDGTTTASVSVPRLDEPGPSAASRAAVARPAIRPLSGCSSSIETELGGVFYLINVALALGLYSDFTTPLKPGLDLSIWDFLTLAGRSLTRSRVQTDPIWTLFRDLAGRAPHERPGAAFAAPDAWRVAAEWLEAFPGGGMCEWAETRGRLRIAHPAGFALVDVPRLPDEPAVTQVAHEMSACSNVYTARPGMVRVRLGAGLRRWIGWVMPYVRARVARALGETGRAAGMLLCSHHARVTTTPAHVDVAFSLAALPVAIRLSGLDRDPGWVPSADRAVAFHYD